MHVRVQHLDKGHSCDLAGVLLAVFLILALHRSENFCSALDAAWVLPCHVLAELVQGQRACLVLVHLFEQLPQSLGFLQPALAPSRFRPQGVRALD